VIETILRLADRAGHRLGLRDEQGFTMIEVLIAAVISVTVIGAGAALFSTGNGSALASQRQGELISVADQQIENIRQAVKVNGFAALTMKTAPASGTNSSLSYSSATHTDPNDFVSNSTGCGTSNAGYLIEANYDSSTEGLAPGVASWTGCAMGAEPLVVQAGGIVTALQTVTVGSDTASVYTYVTDTYIGCSSALGSCTAAAGDARRVVVAVLLNNGGRHNIGQNSPVYVSSIFTNPVPTNQINSSIGLTVGATLG
jgi:prepilin-type N-terminal cleavage/methylation domain-containing protein